MINASPYNPQDPAHLKNRNMGVPSPPQLTQLESTPSSLHNLPMSPAPPTHPTVMYSSPLPPNPNPNPAPSPSHPFYHGEGSDGNRDAYPLQRLNPIGKGASSTVYRAVYLKTLTVCAEKVVTAIDPAKRLLLVRELETLKKTTMHPHVVQLIDVVPNPRDGTLSICLEYFDAGSLQDVVDAGGCRDEHFLRKVSKQLLKGLSFLHSLRLIHRDIKPSNALVSSKGVVKLADFGLARTLGAGSYAVADSFVGTYDYMAPERLTGDEYSFQSG